MKIYDTQDEIASANDLKDKFTAYDRDELDVIGLDCDIQAASGFEEIAEIADDESSKTIYFF